MFSHKLQFVLGSLATCSLLAGNAADCKAQCNCANRPVLAAPVAPITSYRPAYVAAGTPLVPQTVNYMPYTAYRAVYTNMPVTTYQPAPACGPCGGATTVMRPVTTYALRPQLFPYTTYRPVITPVVAYAPIAPACSPCGGAVGVPLVQSQMATSSLSPFAPAPAAPCAGCAAPVGPPVGQYVNPGMPPMSGMPGSPVPSLGQPNINLPPSLNGPPPGQPLAPTPQSNTTFSPPAGSTIIGPPTTTYSATPSAPGATFSNPSPANSANGSNSNGSNGNSSSTQGAGSAATGTPAGNGQPESRLRPFKVIPDVAPPPPADFRPGTPSSSGPDGLGNPGGSFDDPAPKAKDSGIDGQKTNLQQPRQVVPDPQDRMTARPIRQTTAYRPVSADPIMQATTAQPALLDDGGWRAARPAN